MAFMESKCLQYTLEGIETFDNPKNELEQLTTSSHTAVCILYTSHFMYIKGNAVVDLRRGCEV